MKRFTIVLLAVLAITSAADAAPYDQTVDAHIRATVLIVGDSNINLGANQITTVLLDQSDGYLPINASRSGMGIRGYSIAPNNDASNYWQIKLAQALQSVTPDAVVIDLGANDAGQLGTATTTGYANYGDKIDWLLSQLPNVPVFWSSLPCPLEAPALQAGCAQVNAAIVAAPARHPNLTIVRWYLAAMGHPEYMGTPPHYTAAGYTAWANLVSTALDAQFP